MKVTRVCPNCGKQHNTVVENTTTGETESFIDHCYDCFMSKCYIKHPKERIILTIED